MRAIILSVALCMPITGQSIVPMAVASKPHVAKNFRHAGAASSVQRERTRPQHLRVAGPCFVETKRPAPKRIAPEKTQKRVESQRVDSSRIAAVARRDIGVVEGSRRANEMARACGLRSSRSPWCAAAVSDWLCRAGKTVSRTASVAVLRGILRQEGWKRTSQPKVGAVAFYRSFSHVGVVVGASGSTVKTVEGNANNRVMERQTSARRLEYWVSS